MQEKLQKSIHLLDQWLKNNNYKGYDTFDGLNATILRPFTFGNKYLRILLQQGIRRFPVNIRPFVGIKKDYSSKGMGFLARGYIRLFKKTGELQYADKAKYCLNWLVENQSKGYSGAAWGNHFDYQSRVFYLPENVPTIVWVSLIGHAFFDAYECFKENAYLATALSSCEHIGKDLAQYNDGEDLCISYIPTENKQVHNANVLGASLLSRAYFYTKNQEYRALASKSIHYTLKYQRKNFSWYYGEADNLHWVDNFHTAYVLGSIKYYIAFTGDKKPYSKLMAGYEFWKNTFFLKNGTPAYYDNKIYPVDIQCASQAIDTLVFFSDIDNSALKLAKKIAEWTIDNMQDKSGYFYYRKYKYGIINRTPTLHWGQATMMCALSGLLLELNQNE